MWQLQDARYRPYASLQLGLELEVLPVQRRFVPVEYFDELRRLSLSVGVIDLEFDAFETGLGWFYGRERCP